MFTQNINNNTSLKYNSISQKKKMQIHKKIFLTLAVSLLFTVNYGNSCFAVPITQQQAMAFLNFVEGRQRDYNINLNDITPDMGGATLKDAIQSAIGPRQNEVPRSNNDLDHIQNVKLILAYMIDKDRDVFNNFGNGGTARTVTEALLKMYNNNPADEFHDEDGINPYLQYNNGNYNGHNQVIAAISAILHDAYEFVNDVDRYDNDATTSDEYKLYSLKNKMEGYKHLFAKSKQLGDQKQELEGQKRNLELEIEALKAKDPKKLDPKTQAEIKQKTEEVKKLEKTQKTMDNENRPEVIKVQEKLQTAQVPTGDQTRVVQNIVAAIQPSIVSNIVNTQMNINQYDIRTSEDENKPVAAGSQIVDAYIKPKSWDIWAGGHMGNIKQDAANATSANSKTDFYGGTVGIDKIFANNSVFGLALSYGQSNTEYTSKTSTGTAVNEKWTSNYYQADIYAHHNFTDSLFFQLIGGIGTYGDGTTIGNMFDFSSQQFTFGYHGNATIGYSIFGEEDSNFVITPQLSAAYYHLNIPDSIIGKPDSSTFTTLDRVDGIAGLNIKILNLNSDSNSNVKIIPEVKAAVKFRFHDNVDGINADNIKLPVAKSTNSNDLSANALATPEQLFTLGGALTATNNNFSVSLHGSFDFAEQYLAMVGGISVKLSF